MQSMPHLPPGNSAGNLGQTQRNGDSAESSTKVRAANPSASEQAGQSRQGTFKQAIGFMQRQRISADPETQGPAEASATDLLLIPTGAEPHLQDAQQPLQPLQSAALSQAAAQTPTVASAVASEAASSVVSVVPSASRLGGQPIDRAASLATQLSRGESNLVAEQRTAVLLPEGTSKIAPLPSVTQELFSVRPEGMTQSLTAVTGPDQAASALTQQQPAGTSAPRAVWATVPMDAAPGKWGEQMLQVLQDRVYLQASQQMQEARIRLDPPDLGKLDLVVRVDGDRLNVQINANHSAVRDALVQVSERLRAELSQQQFVHVDVNVGTGDQGRGNPGHSQQEENHDQPVIHQAGIQPTTTRANTQAEHWLSTIA